MRMFFVLFGASLLAVSVSGAAHHATAPVYDTTRVITIEGVVTAFRFVNPHATVLIDVTDESGKTAKWNVELAGRLNLSEVGWTTNSLKAGERVTVTGNPSHTGSPRIFFRRIVKGDGTELLPSAPLRLNAVEEERRQRALQRTQPPKKSRAHRAFACRHSRSQLGFSNIGLQSATQLTLKLSEKSGEDHTAGLVAATVK